MSRGQLRWALGALLIAVLVVVGLVARGGSGSAKRVADAAPAWVKDGDTPNARHEAADEAQHAADQARQAKFTRSKGKEAARGPKSPAAEQVGDRAYPRSYVDDRRAAKGFAAFRSLPRRPSTGAATPQAAASAVTGPWTELGPFTPNVAGVNSQFFDPTTLTGPATQESGRVTALAIDPNCAPGACRMWVAAAGGGIWRTDDALASPVTWTPPPADLPTNAFGSLYFDAAHNVLYAGSGEPNGSGDSEAGLGLFRSTDGGASWSLVPGSASVATNRSIGAIAVDPDGPDRAHDRHRDRCGPARLLVGQRRPFHAAQRAHARRLPLDRQRPDLLAPGQPVGPDPAKSQPAPAAAPTGSRAGSPSSSSIPTIRRSCTRRCSATGCGGPIRRPSSPTWVKVFHTMNENNFSEPEQPDRRLHG